MNSAQMFDKQQGTEAEKMRRQGRKRMDILQHCF